MSYFNTTNIRYKALQNEIANAKKQEERILLIFNKFKDKGMTPYNVLRVYTAFFCQENAITPPLTSIRRAITNLTNKSMLEKTGKMKDEIYGKPNNIWRLAN